MGTPPPHPTPDADAEAVVDAALRRTQAVRDRRTMIRASGLFDGDWYRRHHSPAAASDLDPLEHYLARGVPALAPPGPMFDVRQYLRRAWHLRPGQDDPLTHYLEAGFREGQRPVSVLDLPGKDPFDRPTEALSSLSAPSPPPTIAVMVHVFHAELFDEICVALAMMPCRFTLLVSTDAPDKETLIRERIAAHRLDASVLVRVCANRGRNFGPMLTGFRDAILGHDLLLHLHTKKSAYRGVDRDGWRQGLIRTLLPARAVVAGLLQRFADEPGLGVLTANPGPEMRYWAYNWLSNRHLAGPLFERLGLPGPIPAGMFDYPLGGMFWARTEALRPLLEHRWRLEDFPPEQGQTDGTIMHAIERVIVLMAAGQGFGFSELDYERGLCRVGWSSRNLDQYARARHDGLLDTIDQVQVVSFDVFDTLLCRICLQPDAVHRFIDFVAARRFPGATGYLSLRRNAERAARAERNWQGDVDLDAIHDRFRQDVPAGWSEAAIRFVQEEELALDNRALRPRAVMVDALEQARRQGRRVVLCSDSYLPRPAFDRMLNRFGIAALAHETYLSSERGARKDRGDLWTLVADREGGAPPDDGNAAGLFGRLLHVGDNEQSDIQRTADHGIRHFHVLSPAALFALRGLDISAPVAGDRPLGDEILLGPVAARLFKDPYLDPTEKQPLLLARPEDAGFVLFGPLLFAFIAWIARHPAARRLERLFFVSREGWFLHRLYEAVCAQSGRTDLPRSSYFHCSRRAALAAAQAKGLDPDAVLQGAGFHGSLGAFFRARLGFTADPALGYDNDPILLPRDGELVACVMRQLEAEITSHGRSSLQALSSYCASAGLHGPGPFGFVDVGYSGTMQTALQRALGTRLVGLYMGVSHAAAQVRGAGGHAFGAFADGNVASFTGGYGLMLEAFLTAPHGQVIGYDAEASAPEPLFRADGLSQRAFPQLERIYAGVEAYALELMRCWGPDLLDLPFRAEAACSQLEAFRRGRFRLSPELMRVLSVEDDFCGNGEIPVFSLLQAAE